MQYHWQLLCRFRKYCWTMNSCIYPVIEEYFSYKDLESKVPGWVAAHRLEYLLSRYYRECYEPFFIRRQGCSQEWGLSISQGYPWRFGQMQPPSYSNCRHGLIRTVLDLYSANDKLSIDYLALDQVHVNDRLLSLEYGAGGNHDAGRQ